MLRGNCYRWDGKKNHNLSKEDIKKAYSTTLDDLYTINSWKYLK